jgi:hypothetical protein
MGHRIAFSEPQIGSCRKQKKTQKEWISSITEMKPGTGMQGRDRHRIDDRGYGREPFAGGAATPKSVRRYGKLR